MIGRIFPYEIRKLSQMRNILGNKTPTWSEKVVEKVTTLLLRLGPALKL